MLEPQGAVLALTSSADLEVLQSRVELRDFIIENAQSLFQYANSIRKLDAKGDSLYIITGCIKSDSWALAAYNGLIDPQNDVLRLIRKGHPSSTTEYGWTSKGTAEARCGSSQNNDKDQCLFLQGFKMSFSAAFHSKMKGNSSNFRDTKPSDGTSHSDGSDRGNRGQGGNNRRDPRNHASDGAGGFGPKVDSRSGLTDDVCVNYFPKAEVEVATFAMPRGRPSDS